MKLSSGQYYPRIGPSGWPFEETPYYAQILSAQRQFELLCDDLNEIFTFVEPTENNSAVYSHRLRNLLIVAATEFEAQCVGVLTANNVQPLGSFFNTRDYVRLLPIFQLEKYRFGLSMFSKYSAFKPFEDWSVQNPTGSLPWYHAYNKTKHNRESNFDVATLDNAIQAVAGCFCMMLSQTSSRNVLAQRLGKVFRVYNVPNDHIAGRYIERHGDTLTPVDYPFES